MPLAIDLCCGIGGWARGLMRAGWDVIGFDVSRHLHPRLPVYPAPSVLQDVRTIDGRRWRGKVDLIVASPPCTECSRHRLPFRHGKPKSWENPPDLTIVEACFRIAREAAAPLVLENVQGAVKWIGRARARAGPFYLWGDGVPCLLPDIAPCKMLIRNDDHAHFLRPILRSVIPIELAYTVGSYHRAKLEAV